jgi:hypothetical protein
VVGATTEQINLSQVHSHTGGDLHGDVSELMAKCVCHPSEQQRDLLAVLQIWQDLFLDVSLVPVVIHGGAGGLGEVGALEHGCWSGGGGFVVIPRLC